MSDTTTTEQAPATQTGAVNEPQWGAVDPATLGQGLYSEQVNIDPSANSFAAVPPVNDGKYVFRLGPSADPKTPTLQFKFYEAKADKPAMKVLRVNATLTLVQPFDATIDPATLVGKVKTFTRAFSTSTRAVNGQPTNEVASLLAYLGTPVPATVDTEVLAATLNQILMTGQAMIGGSTVWKAGFVKDNSNPKDFGKWTVQGQRNFPVMPGGSLQAGPYNPIMVVNGVEVRAKAYLRNELFSLIAKN